MLILLHIYIYINKILYNIFNNHFCKYLCFTTYPKIIKLHFHKIIIVFTYFIFELFKSILKNLQNLNFLRIPVKYRIFKAYQILDT